MNKPSVTHWSTAAIHSVDRYDAWNAALNANYGRWLAEKPKAAVFNADVERIRNGSMTLIKCTCDPCGAERPDRLARSGSESFAAFQLVIAGRELIEFDGKTIELSAGDLLVWDSTRTMSFEVTQRLSKVSLLMPLDRLRRWLPDDWRGISGKVPYDSASYLMLKSYMTALATPDLTDREFCGTAMLDAGIAMLAGGARSPLKSRGRVGSAQLRRLKDYIRANLQDSELSLRVVAARNGISLRYLHWLFAQSQQTASAYILDCRLDACRNDLLNPAMAEKSIGEIAFTWGFNSAAHFSRSYRSRFGETPSDTRRRRFA